MKTTLKYNTIETFQTQPAWKLFINTLVESCKKLFDNNLITEVNNSVIDESNHTFHITELKPFDKYVVENYSDLSELDKLKYKDIYDKFKDCQTTYENMQTQYAMLGYLNDLFPLNLRENISLRGLLRTLSLYKCKIKNLKLSGNSLPHTYKVEGSRKDEEIYGFELTNKTYDYEARAKKPNVVNNQPNLGNSDYVTPYDYVSGDVDADCFDFLTDLQFYLNGFDLLLGCPP